MIIVQNARHLQFPVDMPVFLLCDVSTVMFFTLTLSMKKGSVQTTPTECTNGTFFKILLYLHKRLQKTFLKLSN